MKLFLNYKKSNGQVYELYGAIDRPLSLDLETTSEYFDLWITEGIDLDFRSAEEIKARIRAGYIDKELLRMKSTREDIVKKLVMYGQQARMLGGKLQVIGFGIEPIKEIIFDWFEEFGYSPLNYFVSTILDVHQLASWVLQDKRHKVESTCFKNLCLMSNLDNNFLDTKQTTNNLMMLYAGYKTYIKSI